MTRCSDCWANNDGGLWCRMHTYEIPDGACDRCTRTTAEVKPRQVYPASMRRLDVNRKEGRST